jgi:hypothetical protein
MLAPEVTAKEPRTKRLVPQHQPRSKWNGLGEVTTLGGSESYFAYSAARSWNASVSVS